jgi:hypothetical protein
MFKIKKGFIIKLRQSRTFKGLTVFMILNFVFEIIQPNVSLALTEGPSQPEVQKFEPIGTTQMVDVFSGDFNYNIPLFNLPGPNGGYPVNLSYHAGVSMDDEASATGLGWNINVGSLVRSMRGLPDEFQSVKDENGNAKADHDYLEVKSDIKESWTLGARGSWSKELFGLDPKKTDLDLSVSLSIYYNNYNGVGVSAGAGIGPKESNYSFGLTLDKENGLGVSADYSVSNQKDNIKAPSYSHKLSLGFNGSLTVDYSLSSKRNVQDKKYTSYFDKMGYHVKVSTENRTVSASHGSPITFARHNYVPSISNKMNSYSISLTLKEGAQAAGVFSSHSVTLFYDTQDLDNDDKNGRKRLVSGYQKAGLDNDQEYTRDFIRSNDGQITKDSKFLPYTQFAYDIYSSSGQGLSGYFRPRRSDIGRSFDPSITNHSYGLTFGLDFGAGATAKIGVDGSGSYGYNSQGAWDDYNGIGNDRLEFQNPETIGSKENVYFQSHGESTILSDREMDHIGQYDLATLRLAPKGEDGLKNGFRKLDLNSFQVNVSKEREETARAVRNTLIHNLKNKEVGSLGEFNVKYFNYFNDYNTNLYSLPNNSLNRSTRNSVIIDEHPAGYKILNQEGSYYVYALPAYNNKEIENLFSVPMPDNAKNTFKTNFSTVTKNGKKEVDYKPDWDNMVGSHKFINKTTKSPYAHSYLLTSVLGADYVDILNDGPTDDDFGYWVKFNYVKYTPDNQDYKWRAPYNDAQYHRGQVFTSEDDKASYQYGEKELWYTGQIETKSHIAVFKLSERQDMKESTGEYNDETSTLSGLKIDEIRIFDKKTYLSKFGTISDNELQKLALQVVHFEYDYSLCKNTTNSNATTTKGKLTLKKVYFTSKGSKRGERNKYEFDYGTPAENPDYAENSYDPWGAYKVTGTNYEHYSHFPYTNQFNQNTTPGSNWDPGFNYPFNDVDAASEKITKDNLDLNAGAWSLKKITLPSGGVISVKYETDDYGYVQHKTANQMFKIVRMGDDMGPGELYKSGNDIGYYSHANRKHRRIYFKLEKPISATITPEAARDLVYNNYVKPIIQDENNQRNLYFKVKMELTHNVHDYVSGYLPLEDRGTDEEDFYGVDLDQNKILNGNYLYGYVTIKKTEKRQKDNGQTVDFENYHPMALAGWNYLQTNASKLLHNPNSLDEEGNYNTPEELLNKLADLLNIVPSTASSFGLIRAYCKSKSMARYIDTGNSVIKLASPDKIKYGGGHRVKEISISDNWDSQTNSTERVHNYGQAYDYTISENGKLISSGVAQYEPQACGDENPLKYPIYYKAKQSVFTKNNLFAEAPINEDMYPGASVGYRRVTVRSLNTKTQMDNKILNSTNQPVGRTGGVTVHEFYTAKEFPTLVEYSNLSDENQSRGIFNVPIPIPLVGSIKRNYYHGTQAYKIDLNDMHGKVKSVKSYELNNYTINSSEITSTVYEYQMTPYRYQNEDVFKLDNVVDIIANDGTHQITKSKTMGVEYDMFTDQRENKSFYQSAGIEYNTDVVYIIPGISVWPAFSNHKSVFRTFVTNKVFHRTGILKKTITKDLQSSNETEIVAYDEKSGQPLLTKIKNEFGDFFYSYNIPAYYQYDRMGHAYKNINYNFNTTLYNYTADNFSDLSLFKFFPTSDQMLNLVKGDEMLTSNVKKFANTYSGTQKVVCFNERSGTSSTTGGTRTLTTPTATVPSGATPYCITYEDVRMVNGVEKGLLNGVLTTVDIINSTSVTTYTVTYEKYDDMPTNNYMKCYFLGWKYGSDVNDGNKGIAYGIVKLIKNFPSATSNSKYTTDLKVIRSGRRNHYATTAANYLTKGLINSTTLADYTLKTHTDTDQSTVKTKIIPGNTVLSATATLFKDDWSSNMNNSDLTLTDNYKQTVDRDINPFISGNSGIWRPFKSYTYVGARKSNASMNDNTTSNPNLKNDGVFSSDVKMFSWDLGNMEDYVQNWEWVNEVTRFSDDSYEIENVNRIGVYSSALYGYDNSLTIGVGGNASTYEIGTDDFETIPDDYASAGWKSDKRIKQNHFNFYRDPSSKNYQIASESVNIKNAKYSGGLLTYTITKPSDYVRTFILNSANSNLSFRPFRSTFGLCLTSEKGTKIDGNAGYFLNGQCTAASFNNTTSVLTVTVKPYMHCALESVNALPTGAIFNGKMTMYEQRPMVNVNSNLNKITVSTTKAHTGKKSMQVKSTVVFDQPLLRMVKDKKYITSVWVSRDKNRAMTFKETTDLIVAGKMTSGVFSAFTGTKITYGKVVEGWQKIDLEFSSSDVNPILAFQFNPGSTDLYVDDIRFSPKTGGITTYVYDPVKYWLKATLNADNYATLYFYDEEGNLTIKKQETEKGIFTITESRGHVAEPLNLPVTPYFQGITQ